MTPRLTVQTATRADRGEREREREREREGKEKRWKRGIYMRRRRYREF